jgi:hypothetical protein
MLQRIAIWFADAVSRAKRQAGCAAPSTLCHEASGERLLARWIEKIRSASSRSFSLRLFICPYFWLE